MTAFKLRNIHDGFWIKHELFYTAVASPFAVIMYGLHERLDTGTEFRALSLIFGIQNLICMIPMNIVPLYLSYQDGVLSRSPSTSRDELTDIHCKSGRALSLSGFDTRLAADIALVREFKLKNDTKVQEVMRSPDFERERRAFEDQMKKEFSIEAFFFMEEYFRFIDEYDAWTDDEVCVSDY